VTRYGLTDEQWELAREELRAELVSTATARTTVTYGELARRIDAAELHARSRALYALLQEACAEEDEAGRPTIGSVVVTKATGIPGDGYFAFADTRLGRDVADRREYWNAEVTRVWDAWSDRGPQRRGSEESNP
jgi:hypothetical protein